MVAWAWLSPYADTAEYYRGVRECTIYVARSARRQGAGRILLEALVGEAERNGHHKLIAKLFDTNRDSVALFLRCGFRDVGMHRRHARLDGEWRDVVVVERLIGPALD